MPDPAPAEILSAGLAELAIESPPGSIESLAALCNLVAGWGRRLNLTGHREPGAIARHLVLDAAALLGKLPSFESVADLGAGAGFPGLPLAILRPGCRVFLVEARQRRHHFQRQAIRELELENVVAIRGRFEEVDPVRCDLVVCQAVAAPDQVVDWMLRWANAGANLAVPGGEVPRTTSSQSGLGGSEVVSYAVPLGGRQRTLWLGRAL